MTEKADAADFPGRFREILSDPLNLLIRRDPLAGTVADGLVTLHNGHRVAQRGPLSYYDAFSDILVFNRGVHEPLEEYCFQQVLPQIGPDAAMIELGAFWAHYAMWFLKDRPDGRAILVEPEADGLAVGKANFARHGYTGCFEQGFVGTGHITVDDLMRRHDLDRLAILHADIQGYEAEMLEGAAAALAEHRVDHVFVSTHSQELHAGIIAALRGHGYRIEAEADFEYRSTSYDGFVLGVRPGLPRIIPDVPIPGRTEIARSGPGELLHALTRLMAG